MGTTPPPRPTTIPTTTAATMSPDEFVIDLGYVSRVGIHTIEFETPEKIIRVSADIVPGMEIGEFNGPCEIAVPPRSMRLSFIPGMKNPVATSRRIISSDKFVVASGPSQTLRLATEAIIEGNVAEKITQAEIPVKLSDKDGEDLTVRVPSTLPGHEYLLEIADASMKEVEEEPVEEVKPVNKRRQRQ